MDQAAPSGALRRRGWRRWFCWLLVPCGLPPLAFALSNLWLASPWGRAWIAAKIHQHSGLEARLGGASWSPWNGVTLRDLVVDQPLELRSAIAEPLLRIGRVSVVPVWRSCWRGPIAASAATFESPRIVLSVQMMSHLAQQAAPPLAPVVAAQPAMPPVATLQPGRQAPPLVTLSPTQATPESAPVPQTPDTQPAAQPAVLAPPVGPPRPTNWIHLRHASFRLVSAAAPLPLVEITDLTSDLPVFGDAARSSLSMASLKAHGQTLLADLQAPVAWQAPVLSLNPMETTLEGIHFQFAGKLAFLSGLPMQLEVQMPSQSPAPLTLPGGGMAKASQLATTARFRGLLLAPATWQGDCFAECAGISLDEGARHVAFDHGACLIALRGGVLSCMDARVVGEDLSLLGNATLFADGRAAGVLRLVAARDTTLEIVRRLLPESAPPPSLTPMNSPQRVACDLEVFGCLNDLSVRLGKDGPVMPLP